MIMHSASILRDGEPRSFYSRVMGPDFDSTLSLLWTKPFKIRLIVHSGGRTRLATQFQLAQRPTLQCGPSLGPSPSPTVICQRGVASIFANESCVSFSCSTFLSRFAVDSPLSQPRPSQVTLVQHADLFTTAMRPSHRYAIGKAVRLHYPTVFESHLACGTSWSRFTLTTLAKE